MLNKSSQIDCMPWGIPACEDRNAALAEHFLQQTCAARRHLWYCACAVIARSIVSCVQELHDHMDNGVEIEEAGAHLDKDSWAHLFALY